jgi:hypothetical protein
MSGGLAQVWYDDEALIYGTHAGPTGLSIIETGMDFKSCGAYPGLAVRNTTDDTSGHVVSATEGVVLTDITFHNGDAYEIYKTTTYDSRLAVHYEDRRFGHKVTNPNELINGIFPEDRDVDEDGSKVFGPGEPWRTTV